MRWPWQIVAVGLVMLLHAVGFMWWRRHHRPRTYQIRDRDGSIVQVTELGRRRPNKRNR